MPLVDSLKGRALPALVLIVGIVASMIIAGAVRDSQLSHADAEFRLQASNHVNIIVEGFAQTIFAIESVGALYGSSAHVSPAQFDHFVTPLLQRYPTITALGWVPRLSQPERKAFEQAAREYIPAYRITERNTDNEEIEAPEQPLYFPILFIRPYEGNEAARGFNLYSNPVGRAAIEQALRSGQTTSTARIHLVQEREEMYSVLLIHPVFKRGGSADSGDSILGVASAVYRIGDGVESALSRVQSAGLNIWLFDRSAQAGEQFLYFHPSGELDTSAASPPAATEADRYAHEFSLGGRTFELIVSPAAGHFKVGGAYLAWVILLAGLGFSVLFAAYVRLILRRSQELASGQRALKEQIEERIRAEEQLREANRTLQNLSRKDALMGIANRRYFDEHFREEWLRAVRNGTPLSLLIGDVDYFKAYNDTYGHLAGDRCLQEIARVLSHIVDRPGDLVVRFGGEEIAVVLPSTPESGAYRMAEKIRLAVAALALPHAQSEVSSTVTISMGCGTTRPTRGSSLEDFIHSVDLALYSAKQQGRNMTVVDDTSCEAGITPPQASQCN